MEILYNCQKQKRKVITYSEERLSEMQRRGRYQEKVRIGWLNRKCQDQREKSHTLFFLH